MRYKTRFAIIWFKEDYLKYEIVRAWKFATKIEQELPRICLIGEWKIYFIFDFGNDFTNKSGLISTMCITAMYIIISKDYIILRVKMFSLYEDSMKTAGHTQTNVKL